MKHVFLKMKKKKTTVSQIENEAETSTKNSAVEVNEASKELVIQMEMLPVEALPSETRLVEITDSKVLAHLDNLIPDLVQIGNAANNTAQAAKAGGVLYRAIIPAGAKLADSKAMEGAVRGIYHGADGIKGHANLAAVEAQKGTTVVANTAAAAMGVASMVVGQYYMTQINAELGAISDSISKVSSFQDNEYRSRVFSLLVHVEKISYFQTEIIENNELRLTKLQQLDSLEEECTQLLGQANLTLADYSNKKNLEYAEYEKCLAKAQNWFIYQKNLLDVLYRISDLRYTLYLGTVSREQCVVLPLTYKKQVEDTQQRLAGWHEDTTKRLSIDTDEVRRKRAGFDSVVHFIPGLINDKNNYRSIETETARMIVSQSSGHTEMHMPDQSNLYSEDVQIVSKDGKLYYLPSSNTVIEDSVNY